MPLSSSSSSSSFSPYGLASFCVSQAASCNSNCCFPQKKLCSCARSPKLDFFFFLGKQPKSVRYNFFGPKKGRPTLSGSLINAAVLVWCPFPSSFLFRLGTTVGNEKRKGNNAPTVFFPSRLLGWCFFRKFLHHFLPVAVSVKWQEEEEGQIEGIGEASLLFRHHPRKNVENSNRYCLLA